MSAADYASLEFAGKSFCFTGKLADLKRTQAEREARARGGLTSKVVNESLDYLVVGSIPATGWKHGSYGRKIEKARALAPMNAGRPRLVPESIFMEALAFVPPTNSGAIDAKVLVATYKFLAEDEWSFDRAGFERALVALRDNLGCHVTTRVHWALAYRDLYGDDEFDSLAESYLVVETRLVRQLPLDEDPDETVDRIERAFEPLEGIDGSAKWFERTEGSADYIRLLREIPETLLVPRL